MRTKSTSLGQRGVKVKLDIKKLELWAALAIALTVAVIVIKVALL